MIQASHETYSQAHFSCEVDSSLRVCVLSLLDTWRKLLPLPQVLDQPFADTRGSIVDRESFVTGESRVNPAGSSS